MPKYREEDIAAAQLAALAGAELKKIDQSSLDHGTAGPASKVDPRQFLKDQAPPAPPAVRQMAGNAFVEQPKARHVGSVPAGVVDGGDIPMIPMDAETIKRANAHHAPTATSAPQPQPAPTQNNLEILPIMKQILEHLVTIDDKLDRIIKGAKITKKRNNGKR